MGNGTLLGSPVSVSVPFNCPSSGTNNPYFYFINTWGGRTYHNDSPYPNITIQAFISGSAGTTSSYMNGTLYTTNVAGISLLLTTTPNQITSSNSSLGTMLYSATSLSTTFTAQLVKTGAVTPGTLNSISLLYFKNYTSGYTVSSTQYGGLTLNAGTQVLTASCSVNTASQNMTVTLPTVSSTALSTPGSTAGRTPFNIDLTCQTGQTVSITMNTSNPATPTGVVAPTTGTGYATGAGVRILNSASSPITFGTAQSLGASPNGALTIPYYAQYYNTNSSGAVGAGKVSATVTFTMSYQ
jgi:type 1 fimbria pilin